ncbi:MAG: adenine phosphoribosyltransferase [Verrucomicrobiota bacterium]
MSDLKAIRSAIRDVQDFPTPGILFKDITPVLENAAHYRATIHLLAEKIAGTSATHIAGIEARGFILAAPVAYKLGLGFIPIRKQGKLPWKTKAASYALEYGEAAVEIHEDAIAPGQKVALIDDVLATGGTAAAAVKLLRLCGADPVVAAFLMELTFLEGRKNLPTTRIEALISY